MENVNINELSADEWDELKFPRPAEQDFDRVVERAISRRGFLGGLLVMGSAAAVFGAAGLKSSTALASQQTRFAFTPIAAQTDSTVHVPEGYSWKTLVSWGDPLFSDAPEFDPATGVPTAGSDRVFGENTDGMELFLIGDRQVLVVNSEYTNNKLNLAGNEEGVPASADEVLRLQQFQGVNVLEITEDADGWKVVVDSPYNRRIHHNTPMQISGPAAGHDLLKTEADPTGTTSLGTFNNCGSGKTPWGTYLTCEENFNGYFGATAEVSADEAVVAGYKRYGVNTKVEPGRYNYHGFDARFDVSKTPNEPHRAGYIVEIDPANADSTPVKRTALGRFKHENAACVVAADGRVVVYLGDDERGEFLYKWVSRDIYVPGGDTSTLLDDGVLHVAKFNDDQTGSWIALSEDNTGMSAAEIAIFTRTAASKVGATTMDRPEWVAVNPVSIEAYCCLTNNSRRGVKNEDGSIRTNAGGDAMTVNAVNPREENGYGQIVRWRPARSDHAANVFEWDLYVMAGNPTVHAEGPMAGSANINAGNLFNSPDGMVIDSTGLIWIQTDGDDSNEGDFAGHGNNQMLAGDPVTGEIHRFLTGPNGSEVTGLCWSADRRTMFVGIQHPGKGFPDADGLPRSSIVAVKRDDNAYVG
ncbi:MAG: PhoX family phosphatase [Hoeflea sp.]|uniref:PhoX family protein n=1 Tax=Hoeflea sp. TaxID=1940281 RepID=UPI001DD9B74F|nr:PhoX family phosphatase [Hoeflea sp.]MBU4528368.1 PhoX family phosphatase [Alphaproteobacteria bacterium]MBU4543037.1 PhoX family phosphatase [Alphaproteobacteria bacterium]MBU4551728.1 PhoX family phosphatase [Alphaproteobacteria bacterium]MBV1723623.1 PhoX family phosphatase [Hoeflea sp.]MBV1761939.1 PhoX family phosphatase [Hoeflea sp.]